MSSKNFYGLAGDVTIDGGILNVGNAQLYANTETSNVGIGTTNPGFKLDVNGAANVGVLYSTFLYGDGSNIENIVSSQWEGSPGDPIYYASNVGIGNTAPVTATLQIGANVVVNDVGTNVIDVTGNVNASYFIGDGSQLTGIAASLDQIVDQGNVVSNTIIIESGIDPVSNIGLVTREGVSISVSNANPSGAFQFGVGSNLLVNVYSSNVLTVSGNVLAHKMTLGTVTIQPAYNLEQVTGQGAVTGQTLSLTNATTGITVNSNIVVGGNVTATSVIITSNIDVGGNVNANNVITVANINVGRDLSVTGNVYIDNMRVADVASNLVTYDSATGELTDSGGLISNKLAIVSEQPPSALDGASTTVTNHGVYTIEGSSIATDSELTYLFDKNNSTVWKTDNDPLNLKYDTTDGSYDGSEELATGITGEWAKITMPYKTILRHIKFESTNSSIKDISIVGLNDDGTTWQTLKTVNGLNAVTSTIVVDASTYHKTYGIIIQTTNIGSSQAEIGDLRLFTESLSVDGGVVTMPASVTLGNLAATGNVAASGTVKGTDLTGTNLYGTLLGSNAASVSSLTASGTVKGTDLTGTNLYGTLSGSNAASVSTLTASGDLAVNTDTLFVDTSTNSVGIGTTTPSANLHVTGNVTIGSTLMVSGFRITAQAAAVDDLEAITTSGASPVRPANKTTNFIHITNATKSTTPYTGALQVGTIGTGGEGGLGVAGNVHVGGGVYVASNLAVNTNDLFVDTTTSRVGIGKTNPATPLDVVGTVTATAFVGDVTGAVTGAVTGNATTATRLAASVNIGGVAFDGSAAITPTTFTTATFSGDVAFDTNTLFVDTSANSVGVGTVTPSANLHVVGNVYVSSNLTVNGNTFYTKPMSVFVDSNVVAEYTGPHGRGAAVLKKYPEIIFEEGKFDRNDTTRTYFQAGYTVRASSEYADTGSDYYRAWTAFDQQYTNATQTWISYPASYSSGDGTYYIAASGSSAGSANRTQLTIGGTLRSGEWIELEVPNKLVVNNFSIKGQHDALSRSPKSGYIAASNDGTTWDQLLAFTNITGWSAGASKSFVPDANTTTAYKYFRILTTSTQISDGYLSIQEIELYGYEEDPPAGDTSVDTTFTSIMNTPQTTGANVYVDAKLSTFTNRVVGPTPVGTAATHNDTGKYWELTGELTSNITVEANTFLEGDQPHAVSVWFNSSNLEANVSNTCVFSISDQEKLDSVNLDLQSNTWHNLTYAYQGEGGSRVTYLDGRKVAEDQAEDTFGEYPPFAMTGYSQGGYVVSQSSLRSGHQGWHVFGNTIGAKYASAAGGGDTFGGTDTAYNGTNRLSSSTPLGAWLKIELPHKIRLQYTSIAASGSTEQAEDFGIYGSNDDNTWDQLFQKTGATATSDYVDYVINATSCYKYFAILVTKLISSTTILAIDEWKLYGHRENDLVRLPDPTNVLKYPHIPLTDYVQSVVAELKHPARRGYVATSSGAPNPMYDAPHAFNGVTVSGNGSWHSAGFYQLSSEATPPLAERTPTSSLSSWTANGGSTTGELTTHTGEWVKIQLPHKIVLSSIILRQRTGIPLQKVRLFSIVGSNDDTNWFLVHQELTRSGTSTSLQEPDPNTMTGSYASVAFKYFAIVIHAGVTDNNTYDHVAIGEWELYGTGVDSIPIQIGGGNIDKVANFRVYDKFVGEDQALEIWDAQKDYFGRAKSSMTLYKGRLGLGTTEPEGRLAVADEPHNLEEFPPRAMTGYKNYFEGHGEFCVSASSELSGDYKAWDAFNHTGTSDNYDAWLSADSIYTLNTNVDVDPSVAANINGVYGEWLELKLPYKITLDRLTIKSRGALGNSYGYTSGPAAGNVWGSNDGLNWTLLSSFTGFTYKSLKTSGAIETLHVNSITPYSYFRLQPTKRVLQNPDYTPDSYVAIGELRYFGTREQGQSVLHDGQLTLTKNLNVPRIGPALDADDTPRRDRLVVEYNTSTNPTFEGAVRDTSGRGFDGMFYGGASYDATEKALVFDGSNDYIKVDNIGNTAGGWVHSFSAWFKLDNTPSGEHLFQIGNGLISGSFAPTNSYAGVSFTSTRTNWYFYSNDFEFNFLPSAGQWYHIVGIYPGGAANTRTLYVNGIEHFVAAGTTPGTSTWDVEANSDLAIGADWSRHDTGYGSPIEGQSHWFDGGISQFKLYDTALTAEEVKTLYDMGRCDEGHHVVNFSKTRVGIGLGDGEAPRAALDVRGDIRYITMAPIALPTLYDHILAGRNGRGMYPILGTNGGTRVYNVYCEPDMYGGGWMCFSQIPRMPDKLVTTVQGRNWSLFADAVGNSGVLLMPTGGTGARRHSTFSVPMNIIAAGGATGYDIDVLLMAYGDGLRTNGNEGAKVGAIWRGVNLQAAMNSEHASAVGSSGLASSSDGVDFTARSYTLFKTTGWDYTISVNGGSGEAGSYSDQDDGTAGYIVHNNTSSGGFVLYCNAISGPGGSWDYSSNAGFEYVRFFVRPSSF